MAGQKGLEPLTLGLEIRCSIQLSYCPETSASLLASDRLRKKQDRF